MSTISVVIYRNTSPTGRWMPSDTMAAEAAVTLSHCDLSPTEVAEQVADTHQLRNGDAIGIRRGLYLVAEPLRWREVRTINTPDPIEGFLASHAHGRV